MAQNPGTFNYSLPDHAIELVNDLPIAEDVLFVSENSQRTLDPNRVRAMNNKGFQPMAVGTIVVSRRADGKNYIVDGQHRRRLSLDNDIKTMRAEVHYGLTEPEEAVLFLILNRESAKPTPLDEYRIGLTAGLATFLAVDVLLKKHGLVVSNHSGVNQTQPLKMYLSIAEGRARGVDMEGLDRILTVAEGIWGRTGDTWTAVVLGSLGAFLARYGDRLTDADLIKKLKKELPISAFTTRIAGKMVANVNGTSKESRIRYGADVLQEAYDCGKSKNRLVPLTTAADGIFE